METHNGQTQIRRPGTDPEADMATLVLPVRQSVLMPAISHPLTRLQIRAESPPKREGAQYPVRRFHTMPLPPSWAEVPVNAGLIRQWCDIQEMLRHHHWTEVRHKHQVRLGYSPGQWAMLTESPETLDNEGMPGRAPFSRAEGFHGDPTLFMPAITEIVVLADSLTITASDQRTGITVESLGFNGPDTLALLNEAQPGETILHSTWTESEAKDIYETHFGCPTAR